MSQPAKNDLLQRSVTGALFVLVVTVCVYWRAEAAVTLFWVFSCLAAYEYVSLISKISGSKKTNIDLVFLLALPYTLLLVTTLLQAPSELLYIALFIPLLLMASVVVSKGEEKSFKTLGLALGGLLFVSVPFMMVFILCFQFFDVYDWRILFSLLTLVWTNDTMAYVTGRLFGKNKLAPHISPGKTIEGFVGGILFAGGMGAVWGVILDGHIVMWMVAGISVGIAATIGDLSESLLKRTAGVKDSGTIFPGHGGVLDRFDGFLAAIVVMVFFKWIGLF